MEHTTERVKVGGGGHLYWFHPPPGQENAKDVMPQYLGVITPFTVYLGGGGQGQRFIFSGQAQADNCELYMNRMHHTSH